MPYTIEIFYTTCAIIGLVFTLFSALISHTGHGHVKFAKFKFGKFKTGHSQHTPTASDGQLNPQFASLSIINPLTVATFIGLFGVLGLLSTLGLNMSVNSSLIFSSLISVVLSMSFSWAVTKLLSQSQSSSVTDAKQAVGIKAKVITKIEKGRLGSISYIDKGTILTLPASSEEDETIERGDEVFIARTDGKMAYVKRYRDGLWR